MMAITTLEYFMALSLFFRVKVGPSFSFLSFWSFVVENQSLYPISLSFSFVCNDIVIFGSTLRLWNSFSYLSLDGCSAGPFSCDLIIIYWLAYNAITIGPSHINIEESYLGLYLFLTQTKWLAFLSLIRLCISSAPVS